ncbi:hypothetical protein [Flagellimonas lutimaris]|uniref:hypothetical protein n=1 Tax=Flagellimonas lutimaris TaxID=475082 RepID=UPI003F5CDF3F
MKLICYMFFLLMGFGAIGQTKYEIIKKSVGFIYSSSDEKKFNPEGTGFFLVVNSQDSTQNHLYFATAKHVIQLDDKRLDTIYIRINDLNNSSSYVRIPLERQGPKKNVFFHNDESVDLAVINQVPDPTKYDIRFIGKEIIFSNNNDERLRVYEGAEAFFTGLFTSYTGENQIYPIVRFGRVALVTDEKVYWNGAMRDLYLIEAMTYWGNSGAPVFFDLNVFNEDLTTPTFNKKARLAGVMSGFFGLNVPLNVVQTKNTPASVTNLGIAAVVPAYLLNEIIYGDELKALRGY